MPAKCAAIPDPAIITFIPISDANHAIFSNSSGVLCADNALISNGILNSDK